MKPYVRNLSLGVGLLALGALVSVLARSPARPGRADSEAERVSTARGDAPLLARAEPPSELAAEERAPASIPSPASPRPDRPAPPAAVRVLAVTGRVVDLEGAPIAGAEVLVWEEQDPCGRVLARAAEHGDFRGTVTRQGWGGQSFTVLADHHRAERIDVFDAGNLELQLGTVRLAPGSEVAGCVTDESGRGIAGAGVAWLPASAFPEDPARARRAGFGAHEGPSGLSELRELGYAGGSGGSFVPDAESAADGRFRLRGLPLGEGFVAAWKYGCSHGWSPLLELRAEPASDLVIVLLPSPTAATQIEGIVRDPAGAARADIHVQGRCGRSYAGVSSAADGSFLLDEGWSAPVLLRAEDEEQRWAPAELAGVVPGTRGIELVLRAPTWLTVRLLDGAERPIPWGLVRLGSAREDTGPDGAVRFQEPVLAFELEAFAPGFRTQTFGPFDPAEIQDELALHLSPGQAVRGRVTFRGRPVAGARLDLCTSSAPGVTQESRNAAPRDDPFLLSGQVDVDGNDGMSGAGGEFVLTLHNDGWHSLRVETEGFPTNVFGPYSLAREAGAEGLELELERAGALAGHVRVAPDAEPHERLVGACNGWGFVRAAPVREDGSYRIENLAPGSYQVRACAPPIAALQQLVPGEETREPVTWDCQVAAGATTRFDLDLSQEGSVVLAGQLTLVGVEPRDWEAALLSVPADPTIAGSPRATTTLDAQGRFELVLSRPGTYGLWLACGFLVLEQNVALVAGRNEWSYRGETGRLRVRLSGWKGAPARLRYCAVAEGGVRVSAQRFLFSRDSLDDWVISVLAGDGRLESTSDWTNRSATWTLVRELTLTSGAELVVPYP